MLRSNVETLGLPGAQVTTGAVQTVLHGDPGEPYDVVLADPPYALDDATLAGVLGALASGGWLACSTSPPAPSPKREGETKIKAPLL